MSETTFKTVSPIPTGDAGISRSGTLELNGRLMEEAGRRSGNERLAQQGRRAQLRAQMLREQPPRHW